jgi:hypothetical protein
MSTDPFQDFLAAYEPARRAKDWGAQADAATELVRRTALEVLRTIDVPAPGDADPLALLVLAKAEASGRLDRFTSPEVVRPARRLNDLYRAVWWLGKSLPTTRAFGSLVPEAPYNDLDHLMSSLSNEAHAILAACPQPPRSVPFYVSASPAGAPASASFEEIDEERFEGWWAVAHSLVQADPGAWDPQDAVLDDDAEWDDLVQLPDIETDAYSDRFREAVESVRRVGDTHAWLPIGVVRAEERRQYWLPNIWGPGAKDTWGLRADLAADRTVVLPNAGDWGPLVAGRVQKAVDDAGVSVTWQAEH